MQPSSFLHVVQAECASSSDCSERAGKFNCASPDGSNSQKTRAPSALPPVTSGAGAPAHGYACTMTCVPCAEYEAALRARLDGHVASVLELVEQVCRRPCPIPVRSGCMTGTRSA